MKISLFALTFLAISASAQAREFECLGLKEAPESNPRQRFAITENFQKIGTVHQYSVYLKEVDGTTYVRLRNDVLSDFTSHFDNGKVSMSVIQKMKEPSWMAGKDLHHMLFCEPTGAK